MCNNDTSLSISLLLLPVLVKGKVTTPHRSFAMSPVAGDDADATELLGQTVIDDDGTEVVVVSRR